MSARAGAFETQKFRVTQPHEVEVCVNRGTPSAGPGEAAPQVIKCLEYEKVTFQKGDIVKVNRPPLDFGPGNPEKIQVVNPGSKGASIPYNKVEKVSSGTPTDLKARKEGGKPAEALSNVGQKVYDNPLIAIAIAVGGYFLIKNL